MENKSKQLLLSTLQLNQSVPDYIQSAVSVIQKQVLITCAKARSKRCGLGILNNISYYLLEYLGQSMNVSETT